MPVNNLCDRTRTLHGWQITLVQPANNMPSNTFQYDIVRVVPSASRQISNILICLCPDIEDEERTALLSSCSYKVYFNNGTSITQDDDCFVQNTTTCPRPNPAVCKGLKFDDIPGGTAGASQRRIVLNFTLTKTLPIGPVNIGFRAGPSSGIWENICGPVCEPITPPNRGIML